MFLPSAADSVRAQGGIGFPEKPLEQKARDKPAGGEVKADHLCQIPAGMLIVPGAQFPAVQPHAGEKFPCKYEPRVGQSAKQQGAVSEQSADGRKEGGTAINGKHPDGGYTGERQVPSAESVKGREGDFQKPPQQAAVNKVVQKFSHSGSVARFRYIYTRCRIGSMRSKNCGAILSFMRSYLRGKERSHELP